MPFDSAQGIRRELSARHERGRQAPSRMERETGIEPATNSLEGCDSTTELLPPSTTLNANSRFREFTLMDRPSNIHFSIPIITQHCQITDGGEGRIRTFEAAGATDLQSVAFDRFATSPIPTGGRAGANALFYFALSRMYSGFAPCATTVPSLVSLVCARVSLVLGSRPRQETWSWRRDLNPRPADYKSAALPD